jgi:hypothetical protein
LSYSDIGQYEEAIAWCEKAIRQEPDALMARIMMTAVYSLAGHEERARVEASEVLRIKYDFSLERFAKRGSPTIVNALRKTGLK